MFAFLLEDNSIVTVYQQNGETLEDAETKLLKEMPDAKVTHAGSIPHPAIGRRVGFPDDMKEDSFEGYPSFCWARCIGYTSCPKSRSCCE